MNESTFIISDRQIRCSQNGEDGISKDEKSNYKYGTKYTGQRMYAA